MSLLADRQAIADAASTVAGVTCTPQYRLSLNPGDACVRLTVANRAANGFGFVNTWQVWVALSQDLATAEAWLDATSTSWPRLSTPSCSSPASPRLSWCSPAAP